MTALLLRFAGEAHLFAFFWGLTILSWTVLGLTVARKLPPVARAVGFSVILIFAASTPLIYWNSLLLSECPSHCLLALAIASALWTWDRPKWPGFLLTIVLLALWTWTRDSNAIVVCLICGALLIGGIRRTPLRARCLVAASVLGVVLGYQALSISVGERWRVPLENVIGQRVLKDAGRTSFFLHAGMPAVARRCCAGHWATTPGTQWSQLEPWLSLAGGRTEVWWLVEHPFRSLVNFDWREALGHARIYRERGFRLLWPSRGIWIGWCFAAIALAGITAVKRRHVPGLLAIGSFLLLAGIASIPVCAQADAMEIWRHCFSGCLMARLGLLLVTFAPLVRQDLRRNERVPAP